MSLENRSNSALFKRAEQLKRWEESETNRESTTPKRDRRKVKFSAGCVFLAACAAGDREEVQRLIQNGADIDTANVDGLTALHQACIDDNLDMVEFLVSRGADVNRGDNEGWTPLHATASCGFLSIARHLMERGADVAAVNNDGELPLDIADSDEMELLLFSNVTAKGIDCDTARNKEERLMLADAKEWLNTGQVCDKPHPKTGATALHVAAAKGYYKVMDVLLQAGADVNARDVDGWTALHAASHWAQREACDLLVEALCDMDAKNYVGQTSEDVSDAELLPHLEELRKKQAVLLRGRPPAAILPPKRAPNSKRRSLDNSADNLNIDASASVPGNNNNLPTTNNQQQIISSVTRMSAGDKSSLVSKDVSAERQTLLGPSQTGDDTPTESEDTHTTTSEESEIEKRNRANRSDNKSASISAPNSPPKAPLETDESGVPSWRRPGSLRGRTNGRDDTSRISNRSSERNSSESNPEVVLRRTQSFEPDDSEKRQSANSAPVSPAKSPGSLNLPTHAVRSQSVSATAPASPSTPTSGSKLSPGNIFKNFFKSFVPPVRDEESETQRKAHAKRVRETRRSTQGVTLEEIKSAEQLVKKKQQQTEPQFLLEDARGATSDRGSTAISERGSSATSDTSSYLRRGSATSKPSTDNNTEHSVTVALRRPAAKTIQSPIEDKDQDKENDSRSAQATQAVIQRRRRPKRRSTGVVHVDMDEIDPDRQEGGTTEGDDTTKSEESDRSGRSSRLSSVSSAQDASEETSPEVAENGQLDYKKLYEESRTDNERLRLRLRRIEDELKDSKNEKSGAKSAMSETEKRERRAMERKLSEMEEELKVMEILKKENQKLKDENGALIRVISKLSK